MTKKKAPKPPSLEIEISGGLDQPSNIKAIAFKPSFKLIDEVLADARARKSDRVVNDLLANFATASQVIGLSLAKLMYGALQIWPEITGVEYKDGNDRKLHFMQTMFSKYGYAKDRVERYLLAWSFIQRHEDSNRLDAETKERFLGRPIKDLIALGQNCNEQGMFTKAQLKSLAAAEDNTTLRQTVAEIRTGDPANSKVMVFRVSDDGSLLAWEGEEVANLGYLSLDDEDDDPTSLKSRAIKRLLRRGQIKEEG